MTTPFLPSEIPFQQVLDALLQPEIPFAPRFLYRFSDLEPKDLNNLSLIWPNIPIQRRKGLMEDIEELGEGDTLLSFEAIARLAVSDKDPQVRLPAVRTLWEYESPELIQIFLTLTSSDPDAEVRAAAAAGLGKFVYLGEIEEIPADLLHQIEERLLLLTKSEDEEKVRLSSLEALGYSSREEIPQLIETAFNTGDKKWMASALYAMGRSANSVWKPQVLEMLDSQIPDLRAEAARAAGELEILSASPRLVELLDDPDEQTRLASIWSLSQLGGDGVRKTLERIYEDSEDDEEREYLEAALDNLTFNEDMQLLPIFDISESPTTLPERFDEDYEQYFSKEYGDEDDEDFDEDFEDGTDWFEGDEEEEDEDLDA